MLLVGLSLLHNGTLPAERAPQWYGLSADTAGRGLRELEARGLLNRAVKVKKAPQAPKGYTQEVHHTLLGMFAKKASTTPSRRLRVVS